MNKILLFSLTAFILVFSSCSTGQSQTGNTNLTATEFAAKIKATENAVIVDVRTPDEYAKGHLVNAQNIDWNGTTFQEQTSKLDKEKPVFVYCLSGGRSASAAAKMRSDGFKMVYELNGGIMKWRGENLPETTDIPGAQTAGLTKEAFDKLLETDKVVLIDFYAEWCGPCKKMKPFIEEIAKEKADKVVVIRINADDNQALCKEMKINALPVIQVYKAKQLTWMNLGFIEKAEIEMHL